jgi:rhodanese-related sulfurtransferase
MSRPGELWARLSLSGRLALLAGLLGAGALLIGEPGSGSRVTLDTQELASMVDGEVDHVTPEELADWLIAGRSDYRLIDLRSAADYAVYHIPTAEQMAVADLPGAELPRDEKLVLYSAEGLHSAQAWFLLEAKQYPAVYILLGGLKAWQEHVVFPEAPGPNAAPAERVAFAKAVEVAKYFGGGPRAAGPGGAALAVTAAPTLPATIGTAPMLPKSPGGAAAKKKKEGC